jgi:hypothetical protein
MLATHERDSTKRTGTIAAFGYFDVSEMRRSRKYPLSYQFMLIIYFEFLEQLGEFCGAEECIDLRDLFFEIVFISLREAACDVEFFDLAFAFSIGILHNGIDGFFFRAVYEAAGIDHYYIAAFAPFVMHYIIAAICEMRHHDLAVHEILGAAECDD